jgi:hypothetical protein
MWKSYRINQILRNCIDKISIGYKTKIYKLYFSLNHINIC